jgi:hypothetical protein
MTPDWSSPTVVRDKAATWWRDGRLLRELHAHSDPPLFPATIRLRRPDAAEIADRFAEVHTWAQHHLEAARAGGWEVHTRRVPVRALGPQEIPSALVVPGPQTALAQLGHRERRRAATFADCLATAQETGAWAETVALARPLDVVEAAADWPRLLAVSEWVMANPRPGVHVRSIPVPGAHTKIVDGNRGLLSALLTACLPEDAIDRAAQSFEEKFGFLAGERNVVLRAAGATLGLQHLSVAEVTWPAAGLAGIDPLERSITQVVVVENRVCLKTVPVAAGRVVVWGAGYGAGELLARVGWLRDVDVVYWGDIDTHGLAILAGVRAAVPRVRTMLMDTATLEQYRDRVGAEPVPRLDDLPQLTAEEQRLYDLLRASRERLEQEHLPTEAAVAGLRSLQPCIEGSDTE